MGGGFAAFIVVDIDFRVTCVTCECVCVTCECVRVRVCDVCVTCV